MAKGTVVLGLVAVAALGVAVATPVGGICLSTGFATAVTAVVVDCVCVVGVLVVAVPVTGAGATAAGVADDDDGLEAGILEGPAALLLALTAAAVDLGAVDGAVGFGIVLTGGFAVVATAVEGLLLLVVEAVAAAAFGASVSVFLIALSAFVLPLPSILGTTVCVGFEA